MTDGNRPSPEAMLAKLEQMQRDAEATLAKFEELKTEMNAESVEVVSDDGLVRVRLDGEGKVAEIGIDEMAMRRHQSLAPTIIGLVDQAIAAHGMKMAEMAQALVGDKIDVVGMVTRDMPEAMREATRRNLGRE